MEDLEEVITYHREALTLRPPGHPDRSHFPQQPCSAVLTRYEQSGRMEDLEEVITYSPRSTHSLSSWPPKSFHSLNNLANAVLTRYEQWVGWRILKR
jgi:hypothetical protein